MFSKISENQIKLAILAETQEAETKWGKTYNSLHEGYAVLKEEVEESAEVLDLANDQLSIVWEFIRKPEIFDKEDISDTVSLLKENAEKLALEAVQVAAVCNKILNGLKK